jgi:hypothetical protein
VFLATDLEVRVRFPALPDFLESSGSGTGSTQLLEYSDLVTIAQSLNLRNSGDLLTNVQKKTVTY